ncbi:uncharacterized protein J8A68_000379 [[Candida] subhashii]|uniref:High affinity potassium transporter n=1 Tax=[Candida] subhashii TaxID=561895 RepID=A0A8J5UMI7_9ASCO|nr:uncharacterized protein J8A68_000379 [[Candida] subhashii]KAG7666123.1 hypothetical protein J8A68_000379 [[Candida] subhashii]
MATASIAVGESKKVIKAHPPTYNAAIADHDMDDNVSFQSIENDDIHPSTDEEASYIEAKEPTVVKQNWRAILTMSFASLGAIYGDLATSPLYTLNSIKYSSLPPSKDDVYGAVSVIFYVFTFIVIIKYICIVLVFGPNNGEGGQVAIYAKIARHLNIGPKGVTIPGSPEESDLTLLTRQDTTASSVQTTFSRIEQIKQHPTIIYCIQIFILAACFIGCSLVISDGLLTPTTSVLSAIGGIQVAQPSFTNVLAVSEVILIALFLIQRFGSAKISFLFAPIIFIWVIGLILCGIYNIVKHHPGIFAALSPYYAIRLLKNGGIDVFGGAMLSITGTEAMFADIGHFGKLPIQISMGFFLYPALMLCYLGQGAYMVQHPESYVNPFFISLPGGTGGGIYWTMFVLATLATVIASQALILSVFSIVSQLINLDCFPKLKITHVSSSHHGKVYIGAVNWMLMIGVALTMAGFKNSNNVTAAYGLGITLDLFVTSTLMFICMIYVYNMNLIFPILFALIFVPLEMCLIVANMKKVPHGAWFPLLIAGLFASFLTLWRWCRSKKTDQEYQSKLKISDVYPYFSQKANPITLDLNPTTNNNDNTGIKLPEKNEVVTKFGTLPLIRHQGVAIMHVDNMFSNSPNTLPYLYAKLIAEFGSIPSRFIFCGIRVLSIPYVDIEDRVLMAPMMKLDGHYKCILRFGYMQNIEIDQEMEATILANLPGNVTNSENPLPVLHIFENDLIRCKEYEKTRNFVKIFGRLTRKMIIDHFYSPIDSLTKDRGRIVKSTDEHEEQEKKIFIGSVVRL